MTEYNPVRRQRRRRRWLVLLLLILIGVWLGVFPPWRPVVRDGSFVLVELGGEFPDRPGGELFQLLSGERPMSLLELLALIDTAAEDKRVAGMVLRVRSLGVGWAKAQDIRDALASFRQRGKPVIAYLEQEVAGSTLEYYVASAAEKLYLPPAASAPLTGLVAHYAFLGGVWEKLDVEMQVEKIGCYKTAGDMIAGKGMSPHHREMADSLLDSVFAQVVAGIADGRGLAPDAVRSAIDRAPATQAELVDLGLADGTRFLGDLRRELLGPKRGFMSGADYYRAADVTPGKGGARKLALVFGIGPINVGRGGGMTDAERIGSDTLVRAFRAAAEDEDVEAIVFRIDSPGGSALASDLIWRAATEARKKKPVIVSMSDVAASGGYYVAAGATKIFAQPGTVTGSIGVVVSKPNIRGLLARLGIATETLTRGRHARLNSWADSLDEEGRARVVAAMQHVYGVFLDRVAEGRGVPRERIDELGQGRVWTGSQARENGLVDDMGGLMAAIRAAKKEAGIPESEGVKLVFYPEPEGFLAQAQQYLGAAVRESAPQWWQVVRGTLDAHDFVDGSILALMPQRVEIR